jgi:hypothetical protein
VTKDSFGGLGMRLNFRFTLLSISTAIFRQLRREYGLGFREMWGTSTYTGTAPEKLSGAGEKMVAYYWLGNYTMQDLEMERFGEITKREF